MLVLCRDYYQPVRLTINGMDVWVVIGESPTGKMQLIIEAAREVDISRNEILPPVDRMECLPKVREFLREAIIDRAQQGASPRVDGK